LNRSKAVAAGYAGVVLFAVFIFLGAGKLAYWQGLLYLALALTGATLSPLLERKGSEIGVERATRAQAGEAWDRRILGAHFVVSIVAFVTAGLDSGRFGWTGPVPRWVTAAGVVLMLLGQVIFSVAKRENDFFSSTVRIQTERGHRVCDTGLYRCVRHPGYLGMLISLVAVPLVLNSYWAFIPMFFGASLLILRTVLEDRFLMGQLPGYVDYARKTRWRMIPPVF
jgi:protein-S-isoprenylcysteine O-methyltransferase Ste14